MGYVVIRVGSEACNLNFPTRESALGVNHDTDKWLLMLLVEHLSTHVYDREPTAIARVRVIPTANVLRAMYFFRVVDVVAHELIIIRLDMATLTF